MLEGHVSVVGMLHHVCRSFFIPSHSHSLYCSWIRLNKEVSVCRRVKGELLGGVSLDLNGLGVSDVEVLWRSLWRVGAAGLLWGDIVQHDGGQAVAR